MAQICRRALGSLNAFLRERDLDGGHLNNRQLGTNKEEMACRYLRGAGMHILERNFRCRMGEIDIIGEHDGYLVFVEVKYRRNTRSGGALAAVNQRKQQKICQVADYYRMLHRQKEEKIRFDVVGIENEKLVWLQNAFAYCLKSF